MKSLVALCTILVLLASACGGGGGNDEEPVLRFTGRTETESSFRNQASTVMREHAQQFFPVCEQIRELQPEGAKKLLGNNDGDPTTTFPGVTPVPGQKASEDDLVRAAEIIQEECAKAFPRR